MLKEITMTNVLPISTSAINVTEVAIVQGGFGRDFMVSSDRGVVHATVAFSCLVLPEPGDRVLLNNNNKENHILAIIERPNGQDMTLKFPANVGLEAKAGNINLVTNENLLLTSANKTQIVSSELAVTTVKANIKATELSVSGEKVLSQWREVNSVSEAFNFVADRFVQRVKNSFKSVEGVDQINSKNYVQNVAETASIRSKNAVITARKDMKSDGERIHMG